MKPRRKQIIILSIILESLRTPKVITQILFEGTLNYRQLIGFIRRLIDGGFVMQDQKKFALSVKGIQFADLVKEFIKEGKS